MPVRSLADIAAARTDLDAAAVAQCQGLLRDLGLLADLAFSDLILWLPVWNSGGYVAAAQVRPSTAPTRYPTDLVGTFTPRGRRPELDRALQPPGLGQVAPRSDPLLPAAGEAIGIGRSVNGPWFAALTRSAVSVNRVAGTLERAYLQAADDLFAMIRVGDFPYREVNDSTGAEPRVGDGLLRVDTAGVVDVRQSERLLSVPPAGSDHRPGRRSPRRRQRPDRAARAAPPTPRSPSSPAGGCPARSSSHRRPRRSRCAPCRFGRPGGRAARWFSSAMSPSCAAGSGRC